MTQRKGATRNHEGKSLNGMSLFAAMLVGGILTLAIGFVFYLVNPLDKKNRQTNVEQDALIQPKIQEENTAKPNYEFYDLLPKHQPTSPPRQIINEEINTLSHTQRQPDAVVSAPKTNAETSPELTVNNRPENTTTETQTVTNPSSETTTHVTTNETTTAGKATIQSEPTEPTRSYILQINSFDNPEDADKRRAQVLLAGVDAQIVKNQLRDGTILYQVISRPMTNHQTATEAQERLQGNGIDSLIVEQRR